MWAIKCSLIFGMTLLCGGDIVVDSPPKITPEWEEKVFGVKNKNLDLSGSVHEMIDGLIEEHFEKDFFTRIETTVKKQPNGHGVYTEYWPNGQLKAKLPYKNGKAHGHVHGWYDNGKDAFKGFFMEGLKQGIHISFYRTTLDDATKEARVLRFNKQGGLERKQHIYHPTGTLSAVAIYKNGRVHGALEAWDLKREQCLAADYKKGVLLKDPPLPSGKRKKPTMSIGERYALEIMSNFMKISMKEYGVTPYSYSASMPFDIEEFKISFILNKEAIIQEAREMIVVLTETFKNMINQHQGIRPYLREYPFTQERSKIELQYYDEQGRRHADGSANLVIIGRDNKICYCTDSPDSKKVESFTREPYEEKVESFVIEPYEEALKIIQAKQKMERQKMYDLTNHR